MSDDPNNPNPETPNNPGAGQPAAPATIGEQVPVPIDTKSLLEAINGISQRIDGIEAKVSNPANLTPGYGTTSPQGAQIDEIDQEIITRKQQLAAIKRGEIDQVYEPEVQASLSSAIARKEGRIVVEREQIRSGFVNEYNGNLAQAYKEFPELADATTELNKETLNILAKDRTYQRVSGALNAKGREAERIDFSALDPAVTLKAARQAHSILVRRNAGKPLSQQHPNNPKLPNTALESGSGAPIDSGDTDLAALEKKAIESGDRADWQRYIKAKDVSARKAKLTA